jgi:two-component system, OmpR family, sensor histidine kinase VicK
MKADTIEVINDPNQILSLTKDLIESANEEIFGIFSSSNAFHRQERAGMISMARKAYFDRNVEVKILVPFDEKITQLKDLYREEKGFEIRKMEEESQITVSVMVIDRKISLVIELKDDTKQDSVEAIGLGTFSNSTATVRSYVSIFQTLWKQNALYEKLKIHDRLQNEFINMAAHELRTPIQPILALSQHLLSPDVTLEDNQRTRYLEIIVRNAARLQQLTEDILDSTKIEMRSLQLKSEKIDLHEIVLQAVQDAKDRLQNPQVHLVLHTDKSENNVVKGDRRRLAQVLANLLNNSMKFTAKGQIEVSVFAGGSKEPKSRSVFIKVKDTGSGIDQQMMGKLFTKFTTKSITGTGLGLFISKGIIEAHGGDIWAENNSGQISGAAFTIRLPLAE